MKFILLLFMASALNMGAGAVAKTYELKLPDLNDQMQNLAEVKEDMVLVHFWATWCGPCVKELPQLIDLEKKQPHLKIILVSVDTKKKTKAFIKKHKMTAEVLHDQYGKALKEWGVEVLPTSFLLNEGRHVVKKYVGATDWEKPEVAKILSGHKESSREEP